MLRASSFAAAAAARPALRRFSSSSLKKTPLYDFHVARGGKMVEFAGYAMPVQYARAGVLQSHQHTRAAGKASLFDVSHMGQLRVTGADRVAFLERAVVGDVAALALGEARLSLLTTARGGILDDCVVTRYADHLYVVVNAGNQDADVAHLRALLGDFAGDAAVERLEDRALVALQGPGAAQVLREALHPAAVGAGAGGDLDLDALGFMHGTPAQLRAPGLVLDALVTRCGYTGEDGFELSVAAAQAEALAEALLKDARVLEAGLGARDSLRLEAGLCLHGHDITTETTPVEAALAWTIGKRRRAEGGFPGHAVIMDQLTNKSYARKRVGFTVAGAAAREGAELLHAEEDRVVGVVTSGTFSPTLKRAVGMAYVDKAAAKLGTPLRVRARGKEQAVTVAKMPFVPARYYKKGE